MTNTMFKIKAVTKLSVFIVKQSDGNKWKNNQMAIFVIKSNSINEMLMNYVFNFLLVETYAVI